MFVFRLLLKNAFRHRLRTALTMVGLVVAISAFGLLSTVVDAWYAGVDATSSTRLITRSSVTIGYPLPLNYAQRIRSVDGVSALSWANWFGGIYIDQKNFFAQFAIDAPSYLPMFPEYVLDEAQKQAFLRDRQGAVIGRKLAQRFGWKVGDTIPLRGTVFPGVWNFNVRAIYHGRDAKTDEQLMFMHWQLVSENVRKRLGSERANQVAVYIVGINEPERAAYVSQQVDEQFRNSPAETRTETEKSFQLGFVAMSQTILMAIRAVSFVVILIIMAVMANTMTMTARERLAEYATLKALGFPPLFVIRLLLGEGLLIAAIGGAAGVACTFPLAQLFVNTVGPVFKVFEISHQTIAIQIAAALAVGLIAALWPAWKMSRIDIVQGLRHVA